MLDFPIMRVLALETSTLAGGVALVDGDRLVLEHVLDVSATHGERVMVAVDRALEDAGWTRETLDGLAVAIGPGSFTGLRIALGTVKGLALALDLPVAAVPTLDAMAAALPFCALPVCPVLRARRDEVYACCYRWDGRAMHRQWEYAALPPAALAARLDSPTVLLGDGAAAIVSPHARLGAPPHRVPSPALVAGLGLEQLRRGEMVKPAELVPLYLRPSLAEVRRRVVPCR